MEAEAPFLVGLLMEKLGLPQINETLLMSWLVMLFILIFCLAITASLKLIPKTTQCLLEIGVEYLYELTKSVIGHKDAKFFFPLIGTLGLYILFSNLAGLIPGFKAPTGDLNTTLALALIVFVLTHFLGIKRKGLKNYLKHYVGPMPWLAPLMIPTHIMGELAKPFSLSIRLFANMLAKHLIIGTLALLIIIFSKDVLLFLKTIGIPIILPPIVMALGILTCFIQTFVFVLLSMIYISIAIEEEH